MTLLKLHYRLKVINIIYNSKIVQCDLWGNTKALREILGSHGSKYEVVRLLGCCTMYFGRRLSAFSEVFAGSIIRVIMEVASISEMLVNFYQVTQCNNPEDSHLHKSTSLQLNLNVFYNNNTVKFQYNTLLWTEKLFS
jgi:hypothetical protein